MTKIEEVARAIYGAYDPGNSDPWDEAVERERRYGSGVGSNRARALVAARAAIAAMREPSPAMVDSGVAFALNVGLTNTYRWTHYVTDKHKALIDAALAEDKTD